MCSVYTVIARGGKETARGKLQATRTEQSKVEKTDKSMDRKTGTFPGRTIFSHLIFFPSDLFSSVTARGTRTAAQRAVAGVVLRRTE
jgi:hypothetical protein